MDGRMHNNKLDSDDLTNGGGGDDGVSGDYLIANFAEKAFSGAVFERKSAAQELLEAFREAYDTAEDVDALMIPITVMDRLAGDTEHTIRATMMEQLPQIALFCHEEGPHLDFVLPQHVLPHIIKLLKDKFSQVRKTAQNGLLLLVERGLIGPSQVEEFVFPVILGYTTPGSHEDFRTEITQFMTKLGPLVGKDIVINSYLDRFCHLCHDTLFQVRRVCAVSIGDIASVVGPTITDKVLVSQFQSLCKDEVWGVRKGCAETITVFSNSCRPDVRKGILTDLFVDLLDDSSRWVRISACQSLGPFITTFLAKDSPPTTPDLSAVEDAFLSEHQSFDFSSFPGGDSSSSSDKSSPVIQSSSLVGSNNDHSIKKIPQFPKITDKLKEMVDQNQNKEYVESKPSADFTMIPMDIDEDVDLEDEVKIKTEPEPDPLSNAEDEKEQNYSTDDVNCNRIGDTNVESSSDSTNAPISNPQLTESSDNENNIVPPPPNELDSNGRSTCTPVISNPQSSAVALDDIEYNTWQYWREPILEIDLDIDMVDAKEQSSKSTMKDDACTLNIDMEIEMSKVQALCGSIPDNNIGDVVDLPPVQSDVHRSYMNLFSATTREQGFEDNGFESLKLHDSDNFDEDNFDDDDDDLQLNNTFPFGDDYHAHGLFAGRNCRPRLLVDLPKTTPVSQDIVPGILLENFTTLCQPNKDSHTVDSEILSYCVYNLPAVVLTLGPQNWSLVRDCYEALACNMQWKIRYTLASSLHEIANILGPELSERDLVPFYNAITKDLDEVRIGILRNLSSFIKMLGGEAQRKCLETLNRFAETENTRNWRFRLELADQIKKLSEIYEAEDIFKHLCPLSMDLLLDRVSEVRKRTLSVIPYLVTRLNYSYSESSSRDPRIVKEFLQQLIKTLGYSEVWVRRQAFAALAGQLIEMGAMSPPQFAQEILPILIDLSKDKVPNVRLKVAQSIIHILNEEYFADPSNPEKKVLMAILQVLQEDEDRDVRHCSQLPELSETETV